MTDEKQLFHIAIAILAVCCLIGFVGVAVTDPPTTDPPSEETQDVDAEIVTQSTALDAETSADQAILMYPSGETKLYINGQIQGNTGGLEVVVDSINVDEESNEVEIYVETVAQSDTDSVTQVVTPYQYQLSLTGVTDETTVTLYHNGSEVEITSLSDQELYDTQSTA